MSCLHFLEVNIISRDTATNKRRLSNKLHSNIIFLVYKYVRGEPNINLGEGWWLQAYSLEPLGRANEVKFKVGFYNYLCIYICHIYKHRQKEFIQWLVKEAWILLYFAIQVAKTSWYYFPRANAFCLSIRWCQIKRWQLFPDFAHNLRTWKSY